METGEVSFEGWWTLNGVKLMGRPSAAGIYINNGKRVVIHPDEKVADASGYVMIFKDQRDMALNPKHIISIITKGDL
jgi:hypothetical protein